MAENEREAAPEEPEVAEPDLRDRRDFLIGLGKWSKAVIGGVVLGGVMLPGKEAEAVVIPGATHYFTEQQNAAARRTLFDFLRRHLTRS